MEKDAAVISRQEEYCRLVDEFYQDNRKFVSEEEYGRAKTDPPHFKALIRKMTDLYQRIGRELFLNDNHYYVWQRWFKREK